MSFTLPVNALSSMQVSLKVELPNGKVAYSMAPSPIVAASAPSIGSKNGMQLHIVATNEESGVLLSLFVSGATGDQLAQEPLPGSAPLDMTLAAVPKPTATDPLLYGGFPVTEHVGLDSNFDETMRVDPLVLLDCFDNPPANCDNSDFVFDDKAGHAGHIANKYYEQLVFPSWLTRATIFESRDPRRAALPGPSMRPVPCHQVPASPTYENPQAQVRQIVPVYDGLRAGILAQTRPPATRGGSAQESL
ncbi:hypothetical protein DFH06DRAFT_1141089 [Mycena polygramma]|nr:hypothetical protein DFH06DRAFT_1141089 [Mycena polygramma]